LSERVVVGPQSTISPVPRGRLREVPVETV
jgi:hypothetical protein